MHAPSPDRWLLRCPVDDAQVAPGVAECGDCGLPTAPLRALAMMAADQLETAARVGPGLADIYVEAASALVPESENFLLDAGRALGAASAYESAQAVLKRASGIAPGRKDIQAELAAMSEQVDPTGWLAEGLPEKPASEEDAAVPAPEQASLPTQPGTLREQLGARCREAWLQQDLTEPGSDEYWALGHEMTRIAIAIAALSSD